MAKCINHLDKEAPFVCKKCWLTFCSSCFDHKEKLCNTCGSTEDNVQKIGLPVYLFAGFCLLITVFLISTFYLKNTKPTKTITTKRILKKNLKQPISGNASSRFIFNGAPDSKALNSKSNNYYAAIPSITGLPAGDLLGLDVIEINIFNNSKDYAKETLKPSWSEGYADYKNKSIYIVDSEGLIDSVLPHEITHLFFDTFMGFEDRNVNWIDEGLATMVQVNYDQEQAISFRNAMTDIRSGASFSLSQISVYALTEKTPVEDLNKYYAQVLSMVDYLKRTDAKKWNVFLESLKSGKSLDVSLKNTYGFNTQSFEEQWLSFIKANKQTWEK